MRALAVAIVLIATPASGMSPAACDALGNAADNAAENMDGVIGQLTGEAFRNAMPMIPEDAKNEAVDVDNARIAAQLALRQYQRALKTFSSAIQNCGL